MKTLSYVLKDKINIQQFLFQPLMTRTFLYDFVKTLYFKSFKKYWITDWATYLSRFHNKIKQVSQCTIQSNAQHER